MKVFVFRIIQIWVVLTAFLLQLAIHIFPVNHQFNSMLNVQKHKIKLSVKCFQIETSEIIHKVSINLIPN